MASSDLGRVVEIEGVVPVRVDIRCHFEEPRETHVETRFLTHLADRRLGRVLPRVEESTRNIPRPSCWLRTSTSQQDLVVSNDQCSGARFRITKVNGAA